MKKYILLTILAAIGAAGFIGCTKTATDSPSDFDVVTSKLTYKIGDTVRFDFSGNPDMIVFYSGEVGKSYANQKRTLAAGTEKLVFQTSMQQGTLPRNPDELRLLISTDLKGYDAESVTTATWTDITTRNTKWPTSLTTGWTTSDSVDISDFNTADKVNIAFRYLGKKSATSAQRIWQMQNLTLSNNLSDGTKTPLFAAPVLGTATPAASTFAYTGWVQVSLKNDNFPGTLENGFVGYNAWNVGTGNISTADSVRNSNGIPIKAAYAIKFDPGTTLNNEDNDDWLITAPVDLKQVNPDAGTVVKTVIDNTVTNYGYIFKKEGTYLVTFAAINTNASDDRTLTKQIRLTITK